MLKGCEEYWYCANCNKYYKNAAFSECFGEEMPVLLATGHDFDGEACKNCNRPVPVYSKVRNQADFDALAEDTMFILVAEYNGKHYAMDFSEVYSYMTDSDGDGFYDIHDVDNDSDGIPDNWEVERGLDPLDAADAALDSDGDGMSNQLEYELGVDPWFFEPNPSEVKSGLYAEFFHTRGEMLIVPDVSKLEMLQTSVAKTISYCDGTWPDKVERKGDLFAARFSGFVKIAKSGTYNFYATSDDGFQLSIGGKKIIQDIEPHSARETASSVFLEKGWQPIELLYYENKVDAVLSLSWSGQGIPKALIPADCLCHIPPPPQAMDTVVSHRVLMVPISTMRRGLGEGTTRRQPRPESSFMV
jgi:hypothetical protein